MSFPTTITIIPGLTLSLTDTSLPAPGSPANIITPGFQKGFNATFTLYRAALFTNSNSAVVNTPLPRPDGGNFIPIVYVKNIDPSNPVLIQYSLVGLGQTFSMQLIPGAFFFLWNPVGQIAGTGIGGIDTSTGIGIQAVAPAVFSPVELFYAA
jgi:hypothetical protein